MGKKRHQQHIREDEVRRAAEEGQISMDSPVHRRKTNRVANAGESGSCSRDTLPGVDANHVEGLTLRVVDLGDARGD